jgi:hypothetical protein
LPSVVVVTEAAGGCTVARERFTAVEVAEAAMLTVERAMAAIVGVDTTEIVEADTTAIVGEDTTDIVGATTDGAADIGATLVTGTDGDSVLALAGGPIGQDTGILTGIALGGLPIITRTMRLTATHTLTMGTTTMATATLPLQILDRDLATTPR